jgi:predicted HicB family RNase H-like nuclease
MKRIIGGVTYNIYTSSIVARWEGENRATGHDISSILYQTQGGAFFVHDHETWAVNRDGEWEERERDTFHPMSREEAHKWILVDQVEILAKGIFDEPPEAEAETTASATIYLRVPVALKQRIEAAAAKAEQSVNVWAMRCLEQCSSTPAKEQPSPRKKGGSK